MARFHFSDCIGSGRSADIYICFDRIQNNFCAAKIMNDVNKAKNEMGQLQLMDHPNVINAHGFFEEGGHAILLLPLLENNLFNFMNGNRYCDGVMIPIMIQISRGIRHMHARNILHMDIKPENIGIHMPLSLSEAPLCRFLDFGSSICLHTVNAGHVIHTTPCFRAPEVLLGVISLSADVFSAGRVFDLLIYHAGVSGQCLDILVSDMTCDRFEERPSILDVLFRLGEKEFGQPSVSGPFWQTMVANLANGDPLLLVQDSSHRLHRIVTLLLFQGGVIQSIENSFWLLQEAARREGSAVLSILPYFHSCASATRLTAYFYARALGFLSKSVKPDLFLTGQILQQLHSISIYPCCERFVLRVLARSSIFLIQCHRKPHWGSRQELFVDFVRRLLPEVDEAHSCCLIDSSTFPLCEAGS